MTSSQAPGPSSVGAGGLWDCEGDSAWWVAKLPVLFRPHKFGQPSSSVCRFVRQGPLCVFVSSAPRELRQEESEFDTRLGSTQASYHLADHNTSISFIHSTGRHEVWTAHVPDAYPVTGQAHELNSTHICPFCSGRGLGLYQRKINFPTPILAAEFPCQDVQLTVRKAGTPEGAVSAHWTAPWLLPRESLTAAGDLAQP